MFILLRENVSAFLFPGEAKEKSEKEAKVPDRKREKVSHSM
jgi:hypothetical protein